MTRYFVAFVREVVACTHVPLIECPWKVGTTRTLSKYRLVVVIDDVEVGLDILQTNFNTVRISGRRMIANGFSKIKNNLL